MNETQNTPELRFEGFTEPWGQRKVADVANRFDNLRVPVTASLRVPGTTPYYGANGIQDYVEGSTHDGEFVLVAEDGANDLKNYPVRFVNGRIWVNNHAHVLQAKSEIADNKYLAYSISQVNIESLLVGGGRAKLNAEALMGINFYLPTFAEQKAIGDYFAAFDSLITLHQCKYERLQHLKQALLQKMFPKPGELVPELRFDGFAEPWEERKLGEIGEVKTGNTPSTANENYYSKKGTPWITPTDIRENGTYSVNKHLSTEGMSVAQLAPAGSILCTCIASIGKNTFTETTCGFNQQINALIPAHDTFDSYFLFFESALWSAQMKSNAASGTMQIVNKTEFSKLEAMIPSLPEQKIIGTFFSNLDSLITLHQRKYERLKRLKQALLRKMFV